MAQNDEIRYKITVDSETGTASVRNLKNQLVATQIPVSKLRAEFGNFAKTVNSTDFNRFNKGLKDSKTKMQDLSNNMRGVSAASGSASSSVLEVGRAISDSNYGMQGMANNLSQLASNLVYTTKAAGGLGKGLRALGKAFIGPLGIVVLLQTAIAYFERMSLQANKTKDVLNDLSAAGITEAYHKLSTLKNILDDTTVSIENKNRVIVKARQDYENLNIAIDENGNVTEESAKAIEHEIKMLYLSAKAKAVNKVATELLVEQTKLATSSLQEEINMAEKLWALVKSGGDIADAAVGLTNDAEKDRQKKLDEMETQLQKVLKKFKEDADPDNPDLGILGEYLYGKDKKKGSGYRSRAERLFKEQIFNLDKFILTKNREREKFQELHQMKLLEIDQRYAREDLKLTYDTFVEKQKIRFRQWTEAEAKRKNMSVESFKQTKHFANEELKLEKSLTDAKATYATAAGELELTQEAERQRKRLELLEKYNDLIGKARLKSAQSTASFDKNYYGGTKAGRLNQPMNQVGADGIESQTSSQQDLIDAETEEFDRALLVKKENLIREGFEIYEVEAMIAEDRFQFQTDLVTREIELERNKVDAKREINQEYISWFSGIGNIMKGLAGENEALATAALVIEKGAAIANVVVATTAANQQILASSTRASAEASALGSLNASKGAAMLASGNPQGAAVISAAKANFAASATIKADAATRVTKNKIGAGISIAQILATTLQSSGGVGGSSGAGGGGSSGRTFDFNLVGSTGENQLAQGIASQVSTPVQAFVVSSQMTSQQQLDTAIQTSATLGD